MHDWVQQSYQLMWKYNFPQKEKIWNWKQWYYCEAIESQELGIKNKGNFLFH